MKLPTPTDVLRFPLKVIDFERRLIAGSMRTAVSIVGLPVAFAPVFMNLLQTIDPDGAPAATTGPFPFLSEEWIAAARAIREEFKGRETTTPPSFRINEIVTEVPFGDGTLNAHTDTSSGELEMDLGHIEGADVTVTLPYEIARAILVEGDQQMAMSAFMQGKIKVEGDLAKLMAMQTAQVDPVALEAAARIQAITAK